MVLVAHWYVDKQFLCLSCLPAVFVFGLLYWHAFLFFSTISSDESAAIPELGEIGVHANGCCSHAHLSALVPDMQPNLPKRSLVEGQLFFGGLGLELSCRL
jgi:hypothetical protein